MTAMVRLPAPVFPELFSFLDNVWPFTELGSIRVESYQDSGRFVLRAQHHEQARHSEFHYGMFARSVLLPAGATVEKITATYVDGILEVAVPRWGTRPSTPATSRRPPAGTRPADGDEGPDIARPRSPSDP